MELEVYKKELAEKKASIESAYAAAVFRQDFKGQYLFLKEMVRFGMIDTADKRLTKQYQSDLVARIGEELPLIRIGGQPGVAFAADFNTSLMNGIVFKTYEYVGTRVEYNQEGDVIIPAKELPIRVECATSLGQTFGMLGANTEYLKSTSYAKRLEGDREFREEVELGLVKFLKLRGETNFVINDFGLIVIYIEKGKARAEVILNAKDMLEKRVYINRAYDAVQKKLMAAMKEMMYDYNGTVNIGVAKSKAVTVYAAEQEKKMNTDINALRQFKSLQMEDPEEKRRKAAEAKAAKAAEKAAKEAERAAKKEKTA